MNKKHAVLISVAVGVAAIAGTIAATKTVHLGRSATARPKAPSSLISARKKALDRTEVALRKALKQKPPKLPPLPARIPAAAGSGSFVGAAAPAPAQAQRVVYVRPAPIIRHVHRAGGEREGGDHESDGGSQHDGGGGGGGGGFDD